MQLLEVSRDSTNACHASEDTSAKQFTAINQHFPAGLHINPLGVIIVSGISFF